MSDSKRPDMRNRPLAELITRVRRPILVDPTKRYAQLGVRSHGKGIFHKEEASGADLGNKKVFEIEPGDLVFNIVFAWEGAVAVASEAEQGRCGSHRFPTYRAVPGECLVEYLNLFFQTDAGRELLALSSPGSAGRNRTLNQGMLLASEVLAPPLADQRRIVDLIRRVDTVIGRYQEAAESAFRTVGSLLDDHEETAVGTTTCLSEVLASTIGGVWGLEAGEGEVDVRVVRSTEFKNDAALLATGGVVRSITKAQLKTRRLVPGDLLLERSGGGPNQPVGRVVFVEPHEGPTVCANFVQLVRPDTSKIDSRYLFFRMWNWHRTGRTLEYQSQTTGIRNLRTKDYLAQTLALPTTDQQREFAALAESLFRFARAAVSASAMATTLRSALLAALLSGERRIGDVYDTLLESA